jgi:hypothetical protein
MFNSFSLIFFLNRQNLLRHPTFQEEKGSKKEGTKVTNTLPNDRNKEKKNTTTQNP